MIRVTKGRKKFEGKYSYVCLGQIVLVNEYNQRTYFHLKKITKIEKQVKDLTLVEMGKLHLAEKYTDGNFTELEGVVHLVKYKIYKLDNYIDITNIVKGSVKEEWLE